MERLPYDTFRQAIDYLRAKRFAQAAWLLEEVKQEVPHKGSIREALGRAYYNWGRYERAKREFEVALKIDPCNHHAHYGLGLSLLKLGFLKMASGHLKLALAMSPGNAAYRRAVNLLDQIKHDKEVDS